MKFLAEVKTVKSRKTASMDIEYQLTLITNNPEVLALGTLGAMELIAVEIGKPSEVEDE